MDSEGIIIKDHLNLSDLAKHSCAGQVAPSQKLAVALKWLLKPREPWVWSSWYNHSFPLPLVPHAALQIPWMWLYTLSQRTAKSFPCQAVCLQWQTITQLPDNAIVSLILLYPSWAMTLTPLSLSHTMSGRPIPSRPRDLVIIPADVKSVQCFCRIMVLKASCSKEQRNIDANRKKKKTFFPKQEFLAISSLD